MYIALLTGDRKGEMSLVEEREASNYRKSDAGGRSQMDTDSTHTSHANLPMRLFPSGMAVFGTHAACRSGLSAPV